MIRKSRARSSSLFLIELILAILFFSVASAVCVQLFVKSHLLSTDSNALNHAVNECANVAEIVASADSTEDVLNKLKGIYPDISWSEPASDSQDASYDAAVFIFYDDAFTACKEGDDATYFLAVSLTEEENMLHALLQMNKAEDTQELSQAYKQSIYELETMHHVAQKTEYATRRDGHEER